MMGDFDGISSDDAKDADVVGSDMENDDVSFVLSDDDMPSDRGGSNGLADKDNNTPHGCPPHESPKWLLPGRDFYVTFMCVCHKNQRSCAICFIAYISFMIFLVLLI